MTSPFLDSIESIYRNIENDIYDSKKKNQNKKLNSEKKEIFIFVLFDIAMIDQEFHKNEYLTILDIMEKNFDITEKEIKQILSKAEMYLQSFKSPQDLLKNFKDKLTKAEKESLIQGIDKLVMADGRLDDYESYLMERYKEILTL